MNSTAIPGNRKLKKETNNRLRCSQWKLLVNQPNAHIFTKTHFGGMHFHGTCGGASEIKLLHCTLTKNGNVVRFLSLLVFINCIKIV